MPAKSKAQQKLFCMALAVRKGDLKRSEVSQSVLDIVDGDMSNEQISHFTKLEESLVDIINDIYNELANDVIITAKENGCLNDKTVEKLDKISNFTEMINEYLSDYIEFKDEIYEQK